MKKSTKVRAALPDRAEFEQSADSLAELILDLKTAEAECEQAIFAARKPFGERIEALKKQVSEGLKLCAEFADGHRGELFTGEMRSAETACATFGFRTAPESLAPRSKMSWERILEGLQKSEEARFIRQKPEVARDVLLAAAKAIQDEGARKTFLEQRGVKIEQAETFWIEPKAKPLAGARVKEAA